MSEFSSIEKELQAGHSVLVHTHGVSMRPLLWQGKTQVLVEPLQRSLEIGDLPLVKLRPGLSRLHRLIRIDETGLYTRGDNCIGTERAVPEQVLGVVTRIYRGTHEIDLNGRAYRMYTAVWMHSAWLRIPIYRIRQLCLRVLRKGYRMCRR